MAMRRAGQSLLPRIAQCNWQGFAPVVAGASPISAHDDTRERASVSGGLPAVCTAGFSTAVAPSSVSNAAAASGMAPTVYATKNPHVINYDEHVHAKHPIGDPSKRAFTYFVLTGGRFIYAAALRVAVLKFILSMTASKDVLAMAALEVDLGKVEMGQTVTVKWRGKPVFVRRRTEAEIDGARAVDLGQLRDPERDEDRAKNPEWLVVVGVCTHLGCVPLPNAGDYHGWFCPCHGSHYDTSGRVRKGPAPYNLEVPEYKFLDDSTLQVG